ncbi:type-F conjugative transfer system mating-pair stabilization protein TraN [Noviherbaspirillum sedimenti]|uniref:Conjugal transfer protein TraN n=1 Tax=Noviherbaspirillum sedimenti TaxID=2320865 RepID=A0A3A3GBJ7_9BURK|nr:type-F conjugative transfer system mating-pair stabilization protein TraN [Noviherbaspirillum sedimenti]RJG04179.1 conjugal transfer protein TraN [Noviherbaspirillum sedimenti]
MRTLAVHLTLCFFFWTQTLALAAPHDEGVAAGTAANPVVSSMVNQASATTVVPGYTDTPIERAYAGQPNLAAQAHARLINCALTPTDPVCQAQQGAMASANTARPTLSAFDPGVAAAKEIARNPSLALGSLASYYSGCTTTDVTTPASTQPRLCNRYTGIGNFTCARSLTVAVDRTPTCTPGEWFAHAGAGAAGFEAQCLPDRPDTAQHFRVTQSGNPVAFFDADLSTPRLFPQPVADLGHAASAGWLGVPVQDRVWIADTTCNATTCTVTALIAPDHDPTCPVTAGGDAGLPACTQVEPFKKTYAPCPASQQSGGKIQSLASSCPDCNAVSQTLDDALCYTPAASATPHVGLDVTGTFGATLYWQQAGARTVTGWKINPAFPRAIPKMTLSYTKPATQFAETERWDEQCPALATGSRCTPAGAEVCIDGPATKKIDGKDVTRACWQYQRSFTCAGGAPLDECAPLAAAGCTPAASTCTRKNAVTGACEVFQDTYQCPVPVQTATTASNCPGNVFCLGASCFNTSTTNDADFARTMSYMEAAREAGVYLDTDRMQVFKGEANQCRDRLLKNCCYADAKGAGMTNQSMFGAGSKLVYDVLMNADNREFLYQGFNALVSGAGFSGSFSTYGVTVAVNGTALPAGSVTLYAGENMAVAFDPWSLAVAVVIYVVISMMSCSEEEGKLAMKEGARLCHAVGSWCSSCIKVLGKCVSCTEHTTAKCCFNSVLSRLVNEQGRLQVGKGWGGAQTPDCSGFTIAQLQSLDFAAMDLTEFYASIVPSLPNVGTIQSSNAARMSSCYYGQGRCQ